MTLLKILLGMSLSPSKMLLLALSLSTASFQTTDPTLRHGFATPELELLWLSLPRNSSLDRQMHNVGSWIKIIKLWIPCNIQPFQCLLYHSDINWVRICRNWRSWKHFSWVYLTLSSQEYFPLCLTFTYFKPVVDSQMAVGISTRSSPLTTSKLSFGILTRARGR